MQRVYHTRSHSAYNSRNIVAIKNESDSFLVLSENPRLHNLKVEIGVPYECFIRNNCGLTFFRLNVLILNNSKTFRDLEVKKLVLE